MVEEKYMEARDEKATGYCMIVNWSVRPSWAPALKETQGTGVAALAAQITKTNDILI